MNNYLCYHVHQHSVQPIYVRQTPTIVLHTQQRMPITLDLPPQNIILRNEEPQPIIVRQQNPNIMIQNESHGGPIDPMSMDPIHHISNTNMNTSNNINLTSEIPTRTTTNFINTFGNVVDTNPFDSRSIMNIQEQPFNQTRTTHTIDTGSHFPSTLGIPQVQIETQGSSMIDHGKEIGMPMGIIEGNKCNKVDSYGYIPRQASMNNIYIPNNNNNSNTPGIVEMNNNTNNYSSPSTYPPMMNYQMEQPNFSNPGVNNPMSYMPSTPMMMGPPPIPVKTNTNVNIPYGNNPSPYIQNQNTNYVHTNENMNYYPEYKY